MRSALLLSLFFGILVLGLGLLPIPAQATIYSQCVNPNAYRASMDISPDHGSFDTKVNLVSKFMWLTDDSRCLSAPLNFDISINANKLIDLEEKSFSEIVSGGTLKTGQVVTYSSTVDLAKVSTGLNRTLQDDLSYGDIINFQMKIESKGLDYGLDLSGYATEPFTLQAGANTKICAYQDSSKTRCLPGSEALAAKDQCKNYNGLDRGTVDCAASGVNCQPVAANTCAGTVNQGSIGTSKFIYNLDLMNPLAGDTKTVGGLILIISTFLFDLAIPLAVIIILYGGFLMLTSGGEPGKYQRGIDAVKWAVLGFAVIIIGEGFVTLVKSLLGAK